MHQTFQTNFMCMKLKTKFQALPREIILNKIHRTRVNLKTFKTFLVLNQWKDKF